MSTHDDELSTAYALESTRHAILWRYCAKSYIKLIYTLEKCISVRSFDRVLISSVYGTLFSSLL